MKFVSIYKFKLNRSYAYRLLKFVAIYKLKLNRDNFLSSLVEIYNNLQVEDKPKTRNLPRYIIGWHNQGVSPREGYTKEEECTYAEYSKYRIMQRQKKKRQECKHLEKKSYNHLPKGTSATQKAYIVPKDKKATKYK